MSPTAQTLLENLFAATVKFADATGKLSNLVGSHDYGQFMAAQEHAEQAGAKCRAALTALEKHRLEHQSPGWY
jgi:hypothetical protein